MLGVGRAAAIPEQQNFPPRAQRSDDGVGCGDQFAALRPQELFFGLNTRLKNLCDCFLHEYRSASLNEFPLFALAFLQPCYGFN